MIIHSSHALRCVAACFYSKGDEVIAAFKNVNFLCFGKRTLAYTKERQYNERKAVSRNENYSTFESG